jgi:hypothetical protein
MIVVRTAYGLKAWKGSSSGTCRVSGYAESEQGLKPDCQGSRFGTAEAVPFRREGGGVNLKLRLNFLASSASARPPYG